VTDSEGVQPGTSMNEDGHRESPVLDVYGGDCMDVGSAPLEVPQGDAAMVMDHCGRDEDSITYAPIQPTYRHEFSTKCNITNLFIRHPQPHLLGQAILNGRVVYPHRI
jgi:hypothetical protein